MTRLLRKTIGASPGHRFMEVDMLIRRRWLGRPGLAGVLAASLIFPLVGTVAHAQQPKQTPTAASGAANATAKVEPKVHEILKAACDVLSGAKTMSFTAVNTYERAAVNGQPLYYTTLNQVTLQRPDKMRVITPGDGVADEFYYDGKTMMAYVPSEDLVAAAEAPPTIDQMIDAAWDKAAVYFPFSDVILSKPCAVFDKVMRSGFYIGQSKVIGGTTTDMVAVAGDDVQAELWIGASDHLPRLIRVVYPHEPAHALYQTEYSDWHIDDAIPPEAFASEKAAKGQPMPFLPPAAAQPRPNPAQPAKHP
jgi:hypothetical protein